MLWYFKNKQAYEYPSNNIVNNSLTRRMYKSIYDSSDEIELYYALSYLKQNSIPAFSGVFPMEELSVNYGIGNDINKEYCDNNNIRYRFEQRSGGCMVLFPGNIITLDIYPTDNFLRQHTFMHDFIEFLQDKGIQATTNNNDLMINNKKVIGSVSETLPEPYKGWIYFGLVISINMDEELISNICTKESVKNPGALSDYGITTEEVMNFVCNWFYEHRYIES